ncbi:MAG: hypothetical protein ACLVL7_04830 [Anaerotruncus massiliensis (ex Togo et al. 2019)]
MVPWDLKVSSTSATEPPTEEEIEILPARPSGMSAAAKDPGEGSRGGTVFLQNMLDCSSRWARTSGTTETDWKGAVTA